MLLEVYKCAQFNRCYVVCGYVLQRVERGSGFRRLCRYDIKMRLIGSRLGEGATCFSMKREFRCEILGANCCMSLLWLRCRRRVYYAGVYLC